MIEASQLAADEVRPGDRVQILIEATVFALIGAWKTVPQIFVNGEHVGGFGDLKEMLG